MSPASFTWTDINLYLFIPEHNPVSISSSTSLKEDIFIDFK